MLGGDEERGERRSKWESTSREQTMPIADPKYRQRKAKYKWASSKKAILPEDYRSCTSINCSSYGAQMPVWFFSKDSRRRDGISTLCKECRAWASRRTRDKHKFGGQVRRYTSPGFRIQAEGRQPKWMQPKLCRIHHIPPVDCQCEASGWVRRPGHAGGMYLAHRARLSKALLGNQNAIGNKGRSGRQNTGLHNIRIGRAVSVAKQRKKWARRLVAVLTAICLRIR